MAQWRLEMSFRQDIQIPNDDLVRNRRPSHGRRGSFFLLPPALFFLPAAGQSPAPNLKEAAEMLVSMKSPDLPGFFLTPINHARRNH
jgi:hypothetical protein